MNKLFIIISVFLVIIASEASFLYAYSLRKNTNTLLQSTPPLTSRRDGLIRGQTLLYLQNDFLPYLMKKEKIDGAQISVVEEYIGILTQYEYDKKSEVLKLAVMSESSGKQLISYKIFKKFFPYKRFYRMELLESGTLKKKIMYNDPGFTVGKKIHIVSHSDLVNEVNSYIEFILL